MSRVSRFSYATASLRFESDGTDCVGRLYRPDRPAEPPVVVLAPGLGATRSLYTPAVAERFAARGLAAFAFDGRAFGESEGTPRGLVSPTRLRSDLRAAVRTVRRSDEVDGDRLAVWGADLSGGVALAVAASDPRVDALVARGPVVAPRSLYRGRGFGPLARGVAAGVADLLGSPLGRPRTLPVAGDPSSPAPLGEPGLAEALAEADPDWENETPARSALALLRTSGFDRATDVACPSLLVTGRRDAVAPPESVDELAAALPSATTIQFPTDHAGLLIGSTADRATGHELTFLADELDA